MTATQTITAKVLLKAIELDAIDFDNRVTYYLRWSIPTLWLVPENTWRAVGFSSNQQVYVRNGGRLVRLERSEDATWGGRLDLLRDSPGQCIAIRRGMIHFAGGAS